MISPVSFKVPAMGMDRDFECAAKTVSVNYMRVEMRILFALFGKKRVMLLINTVKNTSITLVLVRSSLQNILYI